MRSVRVDKRETVASVGGQLAERFEQACSTAMVHPDNLLETMVLRFVEQEEAKMEAIEFEADPWDYAQRRQDELWQEMKDDIDWDSLPSGGPDGVMAQQIALEHRIEKIVEAEWEQIEEDRALRA